MGKKQNNKNALQIFEFPLHRFKSSTIKYYTKITAYELVYTDELKLKQTLELRVFDDAMKFVQSLVTKNQKVEESSKQDTETKPNESQNSDNNKDKSANNGLCSDIMQTIEDIGTKSLTAITEQFIKRDKEIRWVAYLPLPMEFPAMDFIVNWSDEEMGFVGQLYNSSETTGNENTQPINRYINDLITKIASPIASGVGGIISDTVGSVIPGGGDVIGAVGDFIKEEYSNLKKLNLHNMGIQPVIDDTVLILDDVERREFNIRWELIARSPEEMKQIKGMRDAFLLSSLPSKSVNGLEYPFLFEVSLHTSSDNGDETNWFFSDELVIQNITVTPSSDGFSWNRDGNPTKIDLEIHFREVNKMYRQNLKSQIGVNNSETNNS